MYSIGGVSFQKRKKITINNNSGAALTAYQVPVTVTYVAAMQAGFGDLRFAYSDGTNIPYWLESKTDSSTALVWIKVNLQNYGTSPAGDNIVYMYYGNAGVTSASDGTSTFDFFDDFNNGLTTGWNNDSGMTNPGTYLKLQCTSGSRHIYSDYVLSGNYELKYDWLASDRLEILYTAIAANTSIESTGYKVMVNDTTLYLYNSAWGILASATRKNSYGSNNWYSFRITIVYNGSNATIKVWETGQGTATIDYTHTSAYTAGRIGIRGDDSLNSFIAWDNIRIRKYAATEPTVTATGQEEHNRKGTGIIIY